MTTLNLAALMEKLPPETVTWAGFGAPVMLNLNRLTGDTNLTPESGVLEPVIKLLQALHEQEKALNLERENEGKAPINVISRTVDVAESGNPRYRYTAMIEVDLSASLDSLIDPLATP